MAPAGIAPVPGTSESVPDLGTAVGGGRGLSDPASGSLGTDGVQERVQGVSKLLNKTAAAVGEHAKGLGTLMTQFPMASKRLKTAVDHLEKAQQDIVTAITDIVREVQSSDQPSAPPVTR